MSNPGKEHWKPVQRIFRYLRGIADSCLKFGRTDQDSLVMWIQIMLLIWIGAGHSQDMCSLLAVVLWVGRLLCSLLLLCLPQKQNIWLLLKRARSQFGWKVCLLSCVELILALIYSVTVKMLFAPLKIRCFMKGQIILMSSTIMFVMLFHKVNWRYARSELMIIQLMWWLNQFM